MRGSLTQVGKLEAASTTLTLAWTSDAIWWFYRGKATFPIYEPAHDRLYDFFRYDERAHLNNCLVHLCSLFESGNATVNLTTLIEQSAVDDQSKARLKDSLASANSALKKIILLRSNLIAHRNSRWTYDEWFAKAELRHDDIVELLKIAIDVLNELRHGAGLDEWLPNEGTVEDAKALLEAVVRDDEC